MATRLYPTVCAINTRVDYPSRGVWNGSLSSHPYSTSGHTYRLKTSKTDAGAPTTYNVMTNQQANYDMLIFRWMTQPLTAQSISGTLDLCFMVMSQWEDAILAPTSASVVRWKVHAYIAQGQTTVVRSTLLNNYVDSANFPGAGSYIWRSLASAQTLTPGNILDGDTIVIELGIRVVSSPVPTPTYPPTNMTDVVFRYTGVNAAHADAVAGDTLSTKSAWFEFSADLVEKALPSPPANDACADAISIATLPYTSPFVDSTQSADTDRAIWWKFTAPTTGVVFVSTHGSNYACTITIYTGGCGALSPLFAPLITWETAFAWHRSQAYTEFNATAGTEYWVRITSNVLTSSAVNSGGACRLSVFYREAPQSNDLYLPNGVIFALREGEYVNMTGDLYGYSPTGIAIDYTKRTMADLNGGTHSKERLYVAEHDYELVEILDLETLSAGENEVDYIGDPWFDPVGGTHPAQIYVTRAGMLYTGWFGNGYLYVSGLGPLPAILNTVSNDARCSQLQSIDAINGDNQAGAPFTALAKTLDIEVTAPWAIAIDETNNILYYTSGGFYVPVGGQLIKRWNLTTNTQMTDFATVVLQGTNNPGLKGIVPLSDGGLLVCNGTVVNRLSSAGAVTRTYTPSIPLDAQALCDVKLTYEGDAFWVVDMPSGRLFKFNLASGAELLTAQPYGEPGTLVQMALYSSEAPPPPPPPPNTPLPGLYFLDHEENDLNEKHDHYYGDINLKIPNPTFRTAFFGE